LMCDRDEKIRESRDQDRRHTIIRAIKCPFSLVIIREKESETWFLKIVKRHHNYSFTLAEAHSSLRKIAMISKIKSEISRQLKVQVSTSKILSSLRIPDLIIEVDFINSKDPRVINSMFRSRDIYNLKTEMRREELDSLTLIQALIRQLNERQDDWKYQLWKNENDRNQITHLFFAKRSSRFFLKSNYEMLVMNCIYKINRFRMSLLIISDQTALHTNFYVAFCFMMTEITTDYLWVLRQLKTLYVKMQLPDSIVIVTDMKKKLMLAIRTEFSFINHLLCLWHINNNVLANCKKSFNSKEEWDAFFADWKEMTYAHSEQLFWELWEQFSIKYNDYDVVKYLITIYITHVKHFVKCFINRVLHFDITTTSRDKSEHVVFKRQLKTSKDDLKTMIKDIDLLLINEHHNYLLKLNDDKMRFLMKLRKSIFQQISSYIITSAIRRIVTQYQLVIEKSTTLIACTQIFIIIIDLSCNHKIQKRLYKKRSLLMKNVHSHWRFERNASFISRNVDLLMMKESDVTRSRERS
jgi:hypothetical protein